MRDTTPYRPFRKSDRAVSSRVNAAYRALAGPERQLAARIFVSALILLLVLPLLAVRGPSGPLTFLLLAFSAGFFFDGPAHGLRWGRACLFNAGCGMLMIAVFSAPVVLVLGGDVRDFSGWWAAGGLFDISFALILYGIRLPGDDAVDARPYGVPLAASESPRAEYERLAQEAVENERRRRELGQHPDIDRT